MRPVHPFRLAALLCLCLAALACTRKPTSTADMPRLLSPAASVAVLPFSQPDSNAGLLMGQLPDPQGRIDGSHLADLDNRLQEALRERKSSRRYDFLPSSALPRIPAGHSAHQPQALPALAAVAASHGAEYLLVPQVINWHEREGSRMGVTRPAHVSSAQNMAALPIVPSMKWSRQDLPTISSPWAISSAARAAGSPPQNWPAKASARP